MFLPGEIHGRVGCWATVHGVIESDMTEQLIHAEGLDRNEVLLICNIRAPDISIQEEFVTEFIGACLGRLDHECKMNGTCQGALMRC